MTGLSVSLTEAVATCFPECHMDAMERLRRRLAYLLDERTHAGRIRHKALARHMGKSEVWLSNVLSAKRGLRIVDLDRLAEFFHVPVSEFVRETDADLIEVTPTELALLRKLRRASDTFRDAMLALAGLEAHSTKTVKNAQNKTRRPRVENGTRADSDAKHDG